MADGNATPRYAVRGKVVDGTDGDALARYMAQVMAGVIGLALETGRPIINGRPRESWRHIDWGRLCEDGAAEDRIYELLRQEDPEELRRTFNLSLTAAANNLIALNQLNFLAMLGSTMVNIMGTDGGAREYMRRGQQAPRP